MSESAAESGPYGDLAEVGWTPERADEFAPYAAVHRPARVARIEKGGALLIAARGELRATFGGDILAEAAQERSRFPVPGDWVALRDWSDDRTTIEAVLPRHTSIVRNGADRTSHGQVLAANVDLVVVVEHLDPEPAVGRVERLLVLAWGSGATPVVVMTKADLVPDPHGMRAEIEAVAPGVEVIVTSLPAGDGLDELRAQLEPGRTMVLVGPSGAGKSTLVNALAGAEVMETGTVRAIDGKGRHTTTHRELIVLPGRGVVLDTPGLRSVGLVADPAAVTSTFPEIDALAQDCRFRDCGHETEPGCAVLAAIDDGELDGRRLESWRKLQREAAFHARRADARLKAQAAAIWKQRQKHLRLHYKNNPGKH